MPRHVLDENLLHANVRDTVASHHRDIVDEVKAAIASHQVVVVGMAMNLAVRSARKSLRAAGIAHHYLEYGGYFSQWRRRNALKMWTGWPTFPMVFAKGMLIGGNKDLKALLDAGDKRPLTG